jgi:glycosyltransferase involved in cell wall biosynthesis
VKPRVSIITTFYNRPARVFDSFVYQMNRNELKGCELIAVDDGSDRRLADNRIAIEHHYPTLPLRWVSLEPEPTAYSINGYNNPTRAWNHALSVAEGDIIVVVASDVLIPDVTIDTARIGARERVWMCAVTDIGSGQQYLGHQRIAPFGWVMAWNRAKHDVRWDEEYMKGMAFDDNDFTARLALAFGQIWIDMGLTAFHQSHDPVAYSDGLKGHAINERYTREKWGGIPWHGAHDDPLKIAMAVSGSARILQVTRSPVCRLEDPVSV